MDKEQEALLVEAWELQQKINQDLGKLAVMSPTLAYGCIRNAETLIDILTVDKLKEQLKTSKEER